MDGQRGTAEVTQDPQRLLEGLEHAFGALSDALGLGPAREMQRAMGHLLTAAHEGQQAQLALMLQLASAWPGIGAGMAQRLHQQGVRGEPPQRPIELARQWTAAADDVFHEIFQTEPGLQGVAACVRATTRFRLQLNRVVEIASETCNVPTRAEVDDAYREIQQLKRRLRHVERDSQEPPASVEPRPRRAGARRKDAP